MWMDSFDRRGPDHNTSTYLFSEERSSTLDCHTGRIETIPAGGRSKGIVGPVCEDNVAVHGTPAMAARMPLILRQGRSVPS